MKQYIYTLTDPISLEIRYVGKSSKPEDRLKRHLSDYNLAESWTKKNKWLLYLKNENLKPILNIIDEGDDSNINELEIKWISHYNEITTLTNMTEGGDGFSWLGKKHTSLSVDKMKFNHPLRREVIKFDLDNNIIDIFNSIHECSDVTGLDRSHISKCCKNVKNITVGGYYFRFIDGYFPCVKSKSEPDLDKINSVVEDFNNNKKTYLTREEIFKKKRKDGSVKKKKSVIQYNLDGNILGEYKSLSEARDKTNCHIGLISKCCKEKSYYTVNNTTFRFSTDIFDYVPYNKSIQVSSKKICKYNLSGELVEVYDSIKQAVRDNSIASDGNIISCCRRKVNKKNGEYVVVKGFTYRYFDDPL